MQHEHYRSDVDGLRAVAVWLVVLFHAFPGVVSGGFIGVDVFFVISGYLISGILYSDLEHGKYSIMRFYGRRVRRIFPALLVMVAACYAFGWFSLLSTDFDYIGFKNEFKQLGKHIVGGIGFLSNVVLWRENGYFDNISETKPLLHLWSLGVEEQFYIFFPPALVLLAKYLKKGLVYALIVLLAASLLYNLYLVDADPTADFYSPLSRAWELLAGACLAYFHRSRLPTGKWTAGLSAAGLLLILGSGIVFNKTPDFPGWRAILPVTGALAILASSPQSRMNRWLLGNRAMVGMGLISYPLYLWHWPVLSYIKVIGGVTPDPFFMCITLALVTAVAWATYEYVEKPIRFGTFKELVKVPHLLTASVAMAAIGAYTYFNHGIPERDVNQNLSRKVSALQWNMGESKDCDKLYGDTYYPPFCIANSQHPSVFLLGDSHANQLFGGLWENFQVINAGNGAPLDGLRVEVEKIDHTWKGNLASWEKNKNYLIRKKGEVKVVVISASWEALTNGNHLNPSEADHFGRISLIPVRTEEAALSLSERLERSLERTIAFVESIGARAILVIDPPEISYQPRDCLRYIFGFTKSCPQSIDKQVILSRQKITREVFARISAKNSSVEVFDPLDIFCDDKQCRYWDADGLPLYRDATHISLAMSKEMGAKLKNFIQRSLIAATLAQARNPAAD